MAIDILDSGHDALLELLFRCHVDVRREEQMMMQAFGDAYAAYAAECIIPGVF